MKKIGIITYHFAQNYGSVIQCYALQEFLKSKGYGVSVINFVSKEQEKNNSCSSGIKGKIKNIVFYKIRKERRKKLEAFLNFRKMNLNETKKITTINDFEKLVKSEKYNVLISGSDQVFNPNILDYNDAFVIPFKTSSIKVAYAASLGNAKEKELLTLKSNIEKFQKISLRESTDKEIFESVIKRKVSIVCDPVFLLSQDDWIKRINNFESNYVDSENYLLCYFIHKTYIEDAIKIAESIATQKKLKLKIINAGYGKYSFRKDVMVGCGPEDFLKLFKNASYICTDSFHGTSFSIILNKNFNCIDTSQNTKDTRRKNLLEKFNLINRLCYVEDKNIDTADINYKKINETILKYSNSSKKFLEFDDEN